jgi:hypothetical protein
MHNQAHWTDPQVTAVFDQSSMDAPMDGFVLPAKAQNKAAAKTVLEYIGSGPAESSYLKYDEWDVGLVTGLQVPTYNQVQLLRLVAYLHEAYGDSSGYTASAALAWRPGPSPQKASDATAGIPRTFPARTSPLAHRAPADPRSERRLPESRKAYP